MLSERLRLRFGFFHMSPAMFSWDQFFKFWVLFEATSEPRMTSTCLTDAARPHKRSWGGAPEEEVHRGQGRGSPQCSMQEALTPMCYMHDTPVQVPVSTDLKTATLIEYALLGCCKRPSSPQVPQIATVIRHYHPFKRLLG